MTKEHFLGQDWSLLFSVFPVLFLSHGEAKLEVFDQNQIQELYELFSHGQFFPFQWPMTNS